MVVKLFQFFYVTRVLLLPKSLKTEFDLTLLLQLRSFDHDCHFDPGVISSKIILSLNIEPCLESDRDAPTVAPIEAFDEARLQLTKEEAELERSISGISVQVLTILCYDFCSLIVKLNYELLYFMFYSYSLTTSVGGIPKQDDAVWQV